MNVWKGLKHTTVSRYYFWQNRYSPKIFETITIVNKFFQITNFNSESRKCVLGFGHSFPLTIFILFACSTNGTLIWGSEETHKNLIIWQESNPRFLSRSTYLRIFWWYWHFPKQRAVFRLRFWLQHFLKWQHIFSSNKI